MATRVSARLTPREGRRFGFTVGTAFLVLGGITWWRDHPLVASVFASLGTVLVVAALVVPGRLGPVHHGWMAFGAALSRITTPIFMGVIYFLVITPIGLLRRAFGHNSVARPRTGQTYWVSRDAARPDRRGMEHQF